MIKFENQNIKLNRHLVLKGISVSVKQGESVGIIGENGSGKTTLALAMAGELLLPTIDCGMLKKQAVFVSFQSTFHFKHGITAYRQQRWNSPDPEIVPTVREVLDEHKNTKEVQRLIEEFDFEDRLDRMIISLSNGEQRKFELIQALAQNPQVLIIDNAFTGLDVDSRSLLNSMFNRLINKRQSVVLTGLSKDEFPELVQKFYLLKNQKVELLSKNEIPSSSVSHQLNKYEIPTWKPSSFSTLFKLRNVTLTYGDKTILNKINWTVKRGEKWILSGENGAGKTSLLNLIFGDNPKAYNCDIELFEQQKGTGETIWEIKQKIGYISPEMQQFLPSNQTVLEVLCSGYFDSEGLYKHPTSYVEKIAKKWTNLINFSTKEEVMFKMLSSSEQRLVLILRSLIKCPPLLILDEPFQGLDQRNLARMQQLISLIGRKTDTSMIFVTHYRNQIPEIFNLELKLSNGSMIHCGYRKQ